MEIWVGIWERAYASPGLTHCSWFGDLLPRSRAQHGHARISNLLLGRHWGKTCKGMRKAGKVGQRKWLSHDVDSFEFRLNLIPDPRKPWPMNGSTELLHIEARGQLFCTRVSQSPSSAPLWEGITSSVFSGEGGFHSARTPLSRSLRLWTVSSQHSQERGDGCAGQGSLGETSSVTVELLYFHKMCIILCTIFLLWQLGKKKIHQRLSCFFVSW